MIDAESNATIRAMARRSATVNASLHSTMQSLANADSPIGIFDSGFGGLTVAREVARALPSESVIYLGDSARCPYGPRDASEVRDLVLRICAWLVSRDVKMIVIACNTATAAGLEAARREFDLPILGVIEPGARAGVRETKNKRIGVIATKGTVNSGAYSAAIRALDPDITVFSTPTPRFVEIAEAGVKMARGPIEDYTSLASKVYIRAEFQEIARDYLEPLRRCDIDTLVLGCTHFPLLKSLIGSVIGRDVRLINSAREVARDVRRVLDARNLCAGAFNEKNGVSEKDDVGASDGADERCGAGERDGAGERCSMDAPESCELDLRADKDERGGAGGTASRELEFGARVRRGASDGVDERCGAGERDGAGAVASPAYEFFTTGDDLAEFKRFGERVFRRPLTNVSHVEI